MDNTIVDIGVLRGDIIALHTDVYDTRDTVRALNSRTDYIEEVIRGQDYVNKTEISDLKYQISEIGTSVADILREVLAPALGDAFANQLAEEFTVRFDDLFKVG